MANVDLAAIRDEWVDKEFDRKEFEVTAERMIQWAEACSETDARFTDPDNDDFQAHPGFTTQFTSGRVLPQGFPKLGSGRGIDGGKAVEVHRPLRAGETLTGVSFIADVFDKTGRSGTMYFIVHRMVFNDASGEPVTTVDWKMIQAKGPNDDKDAD